MSFDIKKMTIHSASQVLEKGETTSSQLCRLYLDRIKELEPKLHSFLVVNETATMRMAEEADKRRASGKKLSVYDGVPIALKDCIVAEGQTCSCASKILQNVKSPYDSTAAARLRAKGFVFIGRANMDEFAMGSSCENSAYFNTANPWDTQRVPGGSSGGSAAAVAASEVPAALGSDTGGSIRQPAAFCGVVGLKPTYGRVSRYGLVAFASSLDQIGPITKDVTDAAIILDTIGGHDKMDASSLPSPCGGFADALSKLPENLSGVRIGLPAEYSEAEGLAPSVKEAVRKTKETLRKSGAELVEVSLPHTKYAVATYYIIATAEASANLARFDGIRYGARTENPEDLNACYFKTRGKGFGKEVRRRIILGTYVLSSGYYDAYYIRAQKVRTLIRRDFEEAFKKCDVILSPVTPTPAFKFGEKTADPLQMYLADIFTIALNLSGNCGISVPADIDSASGMPIGMQFIAPALAEEKLLTVSRRFELDREIKEFIPAI